jgi:hypothetical protein
MAKVNLKPALEPNGFRFTLERQALFGRRVERIPFDVWDPDMHPGMALLKVLVSDGAAKTDGHDVLVCHDAVAAMPADDIGMLRLPRRCPFALRLQAPGALSDDEFQIKATWLRPDGVEAIGMARTGACLRNAASEYTLLDPLYTLIREIEALNDIRAGTEQRSLLDARMAQMARVKHALAEATGDAQADRYLTQLTIHHATGLGIDAAGPAAQERFEPTLFGNVPILAGLGDNEDQPVQRERLLSDEHARKFQHSYSAPILSCSDEALPSHPRRLSCRAARYLAPFPGARRLPCGRPPPP